MAGLAVLALTACTERYEHRTPLSPYTFTLESYLDARTDRPTDPKLDINTDIFFDSLMTGLNQAVFGSAPARLRVKLMNYVREPGSQKSTLTIVAELDGVLPNNKTIAQGQFTCKVQGSGSKSPDQALRYLAKVIDEGMGGKHSGLWNDMLRQCADQLADQFSTAIIQRKGM